VVVVAAAEGMRTGDRGEGAAVAEGQRALLAEVALEAARRHLRRHLVPEHVVHRHRDRAVLHRVQCDVAQLKLAVAGGVDRRRGPAPLGVGRGAAADAGALGRELAGRHALVARAALLAARVEAHHRGWRAVAKIGAMVWPG